MNKAMSLAEQSDYDLELVDNIFHREDCKFPYIWILLTKVSHLLPVLESAVKNKHFKSISFKQFYTLFVRARQEERENNYKVYHLLRISDEQKILNKFSIQELFAFCNRVGYMRPVMDCISRKKVWKEMTFEVAHKLVEDQGKDLYYYIELVRLLVSRSDCPEEFLLSNLKNSRFSEEIFEAMVMRQNLKLSFILDKKHLPNDVKIDDLVAANSYFIIARRDCSIKKSYEILNKAKEYEWETFLYATMALIEKDELPFNKAIKLMEEISCDKQAISSFEKRKDFTLARRVELILTMNEAIPGIYMSGNEPHYDHYDLEQIVKKGDWLTPSLHDVLMLHNKISWLCTSLEIISGRPDWKKLSLTKALKLAAETGNQTDVLQLIIATKKCSLLKALELAKFSEGDLYDCQILRTIIEEGISSYEESLEIIKKSNDASYTVAILVGQTKTKVPLSGMVELSRNGFRHLGNLTSAINKHEEWATIPLVDAFDYLPESYMEPLQVIVVREDWQALSFIEAYNLLKTVKWEPYAGLVVPSLTKKVDCPLTSAYELISLLDLSNDIRAAVYPVTSRLDNPLENALDLAKKTYHGSYEGIVVRQDWKDLSLAITLEYITQYPNDDLIESLVERTDWQALSFEEAVELLATIDSYHRSIYLGLIIRQENNPLEEVLTFLAENNYAHLLAHQAIRRSDCSMDLASEIFRKADLGGCMFSAVAEKEAWKNLPLTDALAFAKKTAPGFYSMIIERDDWKNLSASKSVEFARKHNYITWINESVVGKFKSKKTVKVKQPVI
jgi:hypothetical protein